MHVKCQFCPCQNFGLCLSLFILYRLFCLSKNPENFVVTYSLHVYCTEEFFRYIAYVHICVSIVVQFIFAKAK